MQKVFILFLSFLFLSAGYAQNGYRIEVALDSFDQDQLVLAHYQGESQFIIDTVQRNDNNSFVFTGEESLLGGVYLIVLPPDNAFFQVLLNTDEQHFKLSTHARNPVKHMKVEGSPENRLFYDYLEELGRLREQVASIGAEMEAADDDKEKDALQEELTAFNEKVYAYMRSVIEANPESMTAVLLKANLPPDEPTFEGTEEEKQEARLRWYQENYFSKIDLGDPRVLRTPFLFERVDFYVHKLHAQHPDTIVKAIDKVLTQMKPAPETYKYYLIHFLNKYAASKYVGMDAVYVYLVDNYYAKGEADWVEEEQLEKIKTDAERLRPLLIGRVAPDIKMQNRDGEPIALHEVETPYTVLYFWRYDCGHCKKSAPKMEEFYQKYKDKGVTLFSVCTKFTNDVPKCWEFIDEQKIGDWLHVVDPYLRSKFSAIYDVRTTPQLYILDKDKRIITKKIDAEQLDEVMQRIMEEDAKNLPGMD